MSALAKKSHSKKKKGGQAHQLKRAEREEKCEYNYLKRRRDSTAEKFPCLCPEDCQRKANCQTLVKGDEIHVKDRVYPMIIAVQRIASTGLPKGDEQGDV